MATIRSYTTIEQSRKLAEILPLESADMWYGNEDTYKITIGKWKDTEHDEDDIPCWSLVALLGVLRDYTLQTNTDETVFVVCDSKKPMVSGAYYNPVDACYELILKLNELNLL